MNFRNLLRGLSLVLAFSLLSGCRQSESTPASPPALTPSPDTTVRVHWLGKRQMQLRMGSFYLMRLWQLPASSSFESKTLTRLSAAPARWLAVSPDRAQLTAGLLYQSLNDVLLDECYLEVRQPTNQPAQLAFAIRLDDPERVGLWETNLANITGLLIGTWPSPLANGVHGWSLQLTNSPIGLQFLRVNNWALFGAGTDVNPLFNEILDRLRQYADPFAAKSCTNWLEADLKPSRFPDTLTRVWHLNQDSPDVTFAISGDGANTLSHGQLTFPEPLHLELKPWAVPTDLIPEPLDSFTAVRGLQPWLASWKLLQDLPLAAAPDQLYFWSLPGKASQAFFAAPMPDARNQVSRLTDYLLQKSNPWLAERGYISFAPLPDGNGVSWGNMAAIRPFFRSMDTAAGSVIFGGMLPDTTPGTNTQNNIYQRPSRASLVDALPAQTNLLFYDWELTGLRLQPCLYFGQVARVVSRHVELPADSPSLQWLQAIQPRLGSCTTTITRTGDNQLTFFRKSTLGFSASELQLMADWLESPQFPFGLYSVQAPPAARQ
jgi:hypothetical protein